MDKSEIETKIENGELLPYEGKLYTKSEMEAIRYAERQAEYYDLLQLTKKITL
jgi:hypothetical protein